MVYRVRPASDLESEAVAGLLDVKAQRFGHVVQQGLNAGAGYPVRQRDGGHQHTDTYHQPLAYLR
jgi:hypothetical protein